MKIIRFLVVMSVFFISCNSENAHDCLQSSGTIIEQETTVSAFTKVLVFDGIELIIKQGDTQRVVIETGTNLLPDIEVYVEDNRLFIKNNNTCNLVRDYGLTKAYVTVPNLTEIRSSTSLPVRSANILRYPNLNILSEDYAGDFHRDGRFYLTIESTRLSVTFNGLSVIDVSGQVENLVLNFASGDGRFHGRSLNAQNVTINHRGTNDIIVNPIHQLKAKLVSTGNVIAVNRPPNVEIEALFTGQVVFE